MDKYYDKTPTEGSNNPVTSGGVFDAIKNEDEKVTQIGSELDKVEDRIEYQETETTNVVLKKNIYAGHTYRFTYNSGTGILNTIKTVVSSSYSSETIEKFTNKGYVAGDVIEFTPSIDAYYLAFWCQGKDANITLVDTSSLKERLESMNSNFTTICSNLQKKVDRMDSDIEDRLEYQETTTTNVVLEKKIYAGHKYSFTYNEGTGILNTIKTVVSVDWGSTTIEKFTDKGYTAGSVVEFTPTQDANYLAFWCQGKDAKITLVDKSSIRANLSNLFHKFLRLAVMIDSTNGILSIAGKNYKLIPTTDTPTWDLDYNDFVTKSTTDNEEWEYVLTDSENRILYGINTNGDITDNSSMVEGTTISGFDLIAIINDYAATYNYE